MPTKIMIRQLELTYGTGRRRRSHSGLPSTANC
jgi:hypothetical protein